MPATAITPAARRERDIFFIRNSVLFSVGRARHASGIVFHHIAPPPARPYRTHLRPAVGAAGRGRNLAPGGGEGEKTNAEFAERAQSSQRNPSSGSFLRTLRLLCVLCVEVPEG